MSDAKLNREKNYEAHAAIVAARKARRTQKSSRSYADSMPARYKAVDQSHLHALYAFCKRIKDGNFLSKHPFAMVLDSREYALAISSHGKDLAIARVRQIFPDFDA